MREQGIIIYTNGNRATVKVDKKDECSKCGMCLFPKNASSVEFSALNDIDAKSGDTVIIETLKDTKLLGAILVFLVPLVLLGVAVLLNALLIKNDIWVAVIAVGLIVGWYAILALIDKRLKKTYAFSPKIVEIVSTTINKEK